MKVEIPMDTQHAEQSYIVRLAIRAAATDPAEAVHEALEHVMLDQLDDCTLCVETVRADSDRPAANPRSELSIPVPYRAWNHPQMTGSYPGQFLG